ncbi:DUF349 domain-containing protein [Odoribacter lunatus]|uniref:DUF349 domain-containing protein n=1 Tax=Odoribacter lunatus TaxID=2941335 RepID=UPI00203D70CF|nr:DUF349 domain-containing protein [Odoribacter lunatus]
MEQENTLPTGEITSIPEVLDSENNISQPEQPTLPDIDFTTLSTEEIINQLQELLNSFPTQQLKEVVDTLPEIFENQYKEEVQKALTDFCEAGNAEEDFQYDNRNKQRFNSLLKTYRDKKAEEIQKIEAERENNLRIKLQLIEELKELVQKEETLNQTFQDFKNIQERWRNTGMVPQNRMNDLLETYHHHVENFYNYIKINKELRDLDLKRNLDAKTSLCEEAEKLAESSNVNEAFKHLQLLHARWKETGPIPKEQKDILWERFKNATTKINNSYHTFFEDLKKEQENNLKLKEELCEKAKAIATGTYQTGKDWSKAGEKLIALQEEWKHTGFVPIKERKNIYNKFRSHCDTFFNLKREFYKTLQIEQEKNLKIKTELCEKVEALQNSTDWKVTTDKIITLQKEWKKTGAAPQKYSNKIWLRFRSACDVFFNNKANFYKNIDSEQEKNLELKKELLEKIKQFVPSDDNNATLQQLKEFQAQWSAIGFVPIKKKEAIQEEFRQIMDAHFDKLNLDEFDKNLEKYRAKIHTLDSGENKEFKIVNEREKLMGKIRQLETDINTWENNIGFIAKSNKSAGLIRELTNKIEKTKQKLALLHEKLKAIDSLI